MTDANLPIDLESIPEAEAGRHANNLELFLDLVFVFAITQITGMFAHHMTWQGALESILMGWLAWWLWTAFTWAGTTIDLDGQPGTRVFVLGMIPALLLVVSVLPHALTTQGPWFAVAYAVVQLWVLALQGSVAWGAEKARLAFLKYAPGAAIGPIVLVIGGFMAPTIRVWVWALVALITIYSSIAAGEGDGEWDLDPVHFAERHSLFVIISLGEVLVAIGANVAATAGDSGLDHATLGALAVATAGAGTLWWCYFAYVPRVTELALHEASKRDRGSVARDVFSFGHFPLILGIIGYAVVAKHVVQHPGGHIELADRAVLAASVLLFVGGLLAFQWRIGRRLARERLIAIAVVVALAALGGPLPGMLVLAAVVSVLAVMSIVTWRSFMRTEYGRRLFG